MPSSYPVIIIVSIVVIYFALKCKDDRKLNKVYIQKRAGRKGRASILTMTAVHITHHGNIKTQNERKKNRNLLARVREHCPLAKALETLEFWGNFTVVKALRRLQTPITFRRWSSSPSSPYIHTFI